jgi:hypothetical protein
VSVDIWGTVPMAKKKARGSGVGKLVRIDPAIVSMAKVVSTARGISLADYLSDILRATVSRDYVKDVKRLEKEGGAE